MSNEGKPAEDLHAVKKMLEVDVRLIHDFINAKNEIANLRSEMKSITSSLYAVSNNAHAAHNKLADLRSEMNDLNERITYLKELSNYKIDKVKHGFEFWLIIFVISLVGFFAVYTIVN
jgi:uncharacterized coiled-coil DUF342 family protein